MCTEKSSKKTYLRLYSADRTGGSNTSPSFVLNRPIENIKSFQVKQFTIDNASITSKFMKINCLELSALTSDTFQGSYNTASQTIADIAILDTTKDFQNALENPVFQCQNARLNTITLDFKDESGSAVTAGLSTQKWSLVLVFNH